jgi:hypothetical protein
MGKALSALGKTAGSGMLDHAKQSGIAIPREQTDPNAHPPPQQIIAGLRSIAAQFFPRLARPDPASANPGPAGSAL